MPEPSVPPVRAGGNDDRSGWVSERKRCVAAGSDSRLACVEGLAGAIAADVAGLESVAEPGNCGSSVDVVSGMAAGAVRLAVGVGSEVAGDAAGSADSTGLGVDWPSVAPGITDNDSLSGWATVPALG